MHQIILVHSRTSADGRRAMSDCRQPRSILNLINASDRFDIVSSKAPKTDHVMVRLTSNDLKTFKYPCYFGLENIWIDKFELNLLLSFVG